MQRSKHSRRYIPGSEWHVRFSVFEMAVNWHTVRSFGRTKWAWGYVHFVPYGNWAIHPSRRKLQAFRSTIFTLILVWVQQTVGCAAGVWFCISRVATVIGPFLCSKNQVFSGLFGGVTFFFGVVLVQELWTIFSFWKFGAEFSRARDAWQVTVIVTWNRQFAPSHSKLSNKYQHRYHHGGGT